MSNKQPITVYKNDVLGDRIKIERVIKDGIAKYNNQRFMVHTMHGEKSINADDPIRSSLDRFTDDEIIKQAKNILHKRVRRGSFLECPQAVKDLCIMQCANQTVETFNVLIMCNRNRVIASETLFVGGINSCTVDIRNVLELFFKYPVANSCILYHCHPNGTNAEPSRADINITNGVRCEAFFELRFRGRQYSDITSPPNKTGRLTIGRRYICRYGWRIGG